MHLNSCDLFRRHALPRFKPGMRVLELGPDREDVDAHMSLKRLMPEGVEYCCANPENDRPASRLMNGEYKVLAPDGHFDIVFSANVVEHVRKLWVWFKELARLTKLGGLVVSVSPVSWPYHSEPDCWRLYPEAYRALFDEAGLKEELIWCGNDEQQLEVSKIVNPSLWPELVIDTIAIGRKTIAIGRKP